MPQALRTAWSVLGHFLRPRNTFSARWGVVVAACMVVPLSQAQPIDLYQAWQRALQHDASYHSAFSKAQAAQSQQHISRSYLLPQLSGGYQKSRVTGWRSQPAMGGHYVRSDLRYNSTNLYAQLRQPLFNRSAAAEYRRGQAVAQHGQAVFAGTHQYLGLQVTQVYFELLLSIEDQQMQHERVQFLAQRVKSFEQLQQHDQATDLDVVETQARLAVAQADHLQAADQVRTHARQLQRHIGPLPPQLHSVQLNSALPPLDESLTELLERATLHNPQLKVALQEQRIYQARLDAATSQYWPTVDLVASFSRGDSEDLATLSQRTNTYAVGINVNIPLFAGGYTTANRQQARYQLQSAQRRYQGALQQVQSELRKYHSSYSSGRARIQALQRAVDSAQRSVDAAQKSFSVGAASNLDVLDAQDEFIQARYNHYQARLEVLLAWLQLYNHAGADLAPYLQQLSQHHMQGPLVDIPDPTLFAAQWFSWAPPPNPTP